MDIEIKILAVFVLIVSTLVVTISHFNIKTLYLKKKIVLCNDRKLCLLRKKDVSLENNKMNDKHDMLAFFGSFLCGNIALLSLLVLSLLFVDKEFFIITILPYVDPLFIYPVWIFLYICSSYIKTCIQLDMYVAQYNNHSIANKLAEIECVSGVKR